tara:strand:- start:2225 stop:2329 length:105 start_codon:yes stop_codon:yes gene_type:complete
MRIARLFKKVKQSTANAQQPRQLTKAAMTETSPE